MAADGQTQKTATYEVADTDDPYTQKILNGACGALRDGHLELADPPVLSGSSDEGEYVMTWLWVSNEDAGITDEDFDE